ncbi:MAG: tetratricopeptide repeat protein [Deltaproteobacteria bacterium]|nr:tetratricopeptide repeat protein [Deltaproteobacteria bacterium]
MGDRRIALVCGSALLASLVMIGAGGAQPAGGGGGSDIEMEPEAVGSGSAKAGSAAAAAPAAPAEPAAPAKDPKLAKKLFAAAQGFEKKGDQLAKQNKADDAKAQYIEAINAYQKAIEQADPIDPAWTFALAVVQDKAGDSAAAYKQLKAFVAMQPPPKADLLKKAQAKFDEVDAKVGKVTLTVKPDGTQIMMGDKTVGEAPMTDALILSPGTYTISFAAVGFEPKDVELKIEAGSETDRKIELVPVKVKIKPHETEGEPETPVVTKPNMLPVYVGGGATAVLLVTSIVYDFRAKHQHDIYTAKATATKDRLDARDNGKLFAHVADATLVGAIGAAAFSGYWYWYKVRPAQAAMGKEKQAKVAPVPWVEPGAAGITFGGEF